MQQQLITQKNASSLKLCVASKNFNNDKNVHCVEGIFGSAVDFYDFFALGGERSEMMGGRGVIVSTLGVPSEGPRKD